MVLALGRTNPLKNLPLTIDAWRGLAERTPGGRARAVPVRDRARAGGRRTGIAYVESPSDERVNELFNEATVFIQTSTHEGFALPPLESMATGGAVVCTDAHGNRDFCVDGDNCLMPEPEAGVCERRAGAAARDPRLRERLGARRHRDGQGLRVGAADRRARGLPGRGRPAREQLVLDGEGVERRGADSARGSGGGLRDEQPAER